MVFMRVRVTLQPRSNLLLTLTFNPITKVLRVFYCLLKARPVAKGGSLPVAVRRQLPRMSLTPGAAASLLHAATCGLRASLAE